MTGRYLRIDPITIGDGPNLYAYVLNNPLKSVDPYAMFTYNADPPRTEKLKGAALNLATCMEMYLGKCSFIVSGGSECTKDGRHIPGGPKNSKHCTDQAYDMWASGMDKKEVFCAALRCGAQCILDEGNHWHFQTVKCRNGYQGSLPKKEDCECKNK